MVVLWVVIGIVVVVGIIVAIFGWDRYRGSRSGGGSGGATGGNETARPTDEVFIDPETGKRMRVWYDPATGQRQYRPE